MNAEFDILDAYRADQDIIAASDSTRNADAWIRLGVMLQRAITVGEAVREEYLASVVASLRHEGVHQVLRERAIDSGAHPGQGIATAIEVLATEAEEAGAYATATTLIDLGRTLAGFQDPASHGRLLALQARILRKIGELDRALELYEAVGGLGEQQGLAELVARARLGKATVAQVRGNYPEARDQYRAALSVAETITGSAAARELSAHALHGLLVAAAVAEDFDTALEFGWLAVHAATHHQHRLELMVNLASVCLLSGQTKAALNAYLSVLGQTKILRVQLAAFGGAAVAAARSGDGAAAVRLMSAAVPLLRTGGHEYQVADAFREFAEASAILGDTETANRYREAAVQRAKRHGFFEVLHRLGSPSWLTVPATENRHLAPSALRVADFLAAEDSAALLEAAITA